MHKASKKCGTFSNRCFIVVAVLIAVIFLTIPILKTARASDSRPVVAYSGTYLAGGKNSEKNYPVFNRNKAQLSSSVKSIMERLNADKLLPFDIISETDVESRKWEIGSAYSLAVIVTRDDVYSEKYETSVAAIYKTIVNIGLVVIIYQTGEDVYGNKRNTIISSVPLTGYSMNLQGKQKLSDAEIDELFIRTATATLEEHLSKRLAKISISDTNGIVRDVGDGKAVINIGALNGLVEGQNVRFIKDGKKVASGRIEQLRKTEAVVKVETKGFMPQKDTAVSASIIKGVSAESYQVTSFKISSKNASQVFSENVIGPQVAQWFSDYLSERTGKVVLPSRIGGEWDVSSTEAAFMLLMKDGEEHRFEMPPPKYPIALDLTGMSGRRIEGNKINEIWMYKVWLKVEIPAKSYSREFESYGTKNTVPGVQFFQEKDEFFDLLHQLTAKIPLEGEL